MTAKLITLLVIIGACGLALSYDFWPQHQPPASSTAAPASKNFVAVPDFNFETLDKHSHAIKILPEPGILLHFWASWCAPCQTEFPHLLKQVEAAQGRLALVAISIDDKQAAMEHFMARQKLPNSPHIYWVWDQDKSISLQLFNTASVPETILINAQRMMVDKIAGAPNWADPAIQQQLDSLGAQMMPR